MELKQSDRDALRASQDKLNPKHFIGNIVEHKTQDPARYKQLSREEQRAEETDNSSDHNQKPKVVYESKFYNQETNRQLESLKEEESDLPITSTDVQTNCWLNMDQVEFDKLEWMSSKSNKLRQERQEGTARFLKDGRPSLRCNNVPPKDSTSKEATEEEVSHDIDSLVNLLDSAYQPQVTYALKVITNIADLATFGFYDGSFDENIHEILIKNCLLRVRHQIDNPNETICQHALMCMRSLLCNTKVDEVVLDRIYPLISEEPDANLWLQTYEMTTQEFTIEMKDSECVEIDAVLALIIRTDIFKRFLYLLQVKKEGEFSLTYNECILDILIRFSRHSLEVCSLLNNKELFNSLVKLFLPSAITSEIKKVLPLSIKALKLIRIIAQATKETEIELRKKASRNTIESKIPDTILESIRAYFCIDCYNLPTDQAESLFKLHIESLRIIKTLSKLKKFRNDILSLVALAQAQICTSIKALHSLKATNLLSSKISIDWLYAAHLIDLVGYLSMKPQTGQANLVFLGVCWNTYIKPIFFQWLIDVIRSREVPHLDVSLAIYVSVQYHKDIADKDAKILNDILFNSDSHLDKVVQAFYNDLTRLAYQNSQLPNFANDSGRLRDPKCLPSYGMIAFNNSQEHQFKLNAVFDNLNSPYILLDMFLTMVQEANVLDKFVRLIDNNSLIRYVRDITSFYDNDTKYEALVQQSLSCQFEVKIAAKALLLVGHYYLDYASEVDVDGYKINAKESTELERSRFESYNNLCHYAIALITLIDPEQIAETKLIEIKDQLFEKVLLNKTLQDRVARSGYRKNRGISSIDNNDWRTYEFRKLDDASKMFLELEKKYLHILVPLYTSCLQVDRYWIFEPILHYYFDQLTNPTPKDEHWFMKNIAFKSHNVELAGCTDSSIISTILNFHFSMLLYSPSYSSLVVAPNVDDYLCIIGSLFFHDNIFWDQDVSTYLGYNIRTMLNDCLRGLKGELKTPFQDASRMIKPLNLPLNDFFNKLVDQFESVSYGNIALSNLLLLFITSDSDIVFRRKLFQEKTETCLAQLRICLDDLWAPKELFFGKKEEDSALRSIITRSRPFVIRGSFLDDYVRFHKS